jgi:hypothetical protein
LRAQRNGADFGKAEAKPEERVRHVGALVEAGRYADRIAKIQSERPHRKSRIVARLPDPRGQSQRPDGQRVGVFRLEGAQQRPGNEVEEPDHGTLHEYGTHLINGHGIIQDDLDSKVM